MHKADIIIRFGDVKYSCELTDDGWFHTIKSDNWTAFISEYEDELISTVFKKDKLVNPAIEEQTFVEVLDEIENRINTI